MVPAPFVLYKYGAYIRSKCVYSSEAEKAMFALRAKAAQAPQEDPIRGRSSMASSEGTETTVTTEKGEVEAIKTPASRQRRAASTASDPQRLLRTTSRAESLGEAAAYEASPYDIDRINTNASVAGVDLKRIITNKSTR